MKSFRHVAPEVNAGSMADIAFLLLIFFLVTTTISVDEGINRKLPKNCPPNTDCTIDINQRNILSIVLNGKDDIFIDNKIIALNELKATVKTFLDNNGDKSCSYCNGKNDPNLSDNPINAVISLQNDKLTSYSFYIEVQDELTKAYYELRSQYATQVLGKTIADLTEEELKTVRNMYPFILSEAETKE